MNNYIVYIHISPNNKRYIGITRQSPKDRWKNGQGYKNNEYFTNAINKYGWNNFKHIIIAKGLNEDEAKWLEIELIREWNTTNREKGYNITKGGDNNPMDNEESRNKVKAFWTDEARKQQSEKFKGENNPMYGICRYGEDNYFYGKHHSEETKEYLREINIGKVTSEETKLKIGNSLRGRFVGENAYWYGKHRSDETREKISKATKGKNNPRAKSVICITTNKIFLTLKEGSEYYNIKNSSNIIRCCKGKLKSAGKLKDGTRLVWRYLVWNHNKIYRIQGARKYEK